MQGRGKDRRGKSFFEASADLERGGRDNDMNRVILDKAYREQLYGENNL